MSKSRSKHSDEEENTRKKITITNHHSQKKYHGGMMRKRGKERLSNIKRKEDNLIKESKKKINDGQNKTQDQR